MLDKTQSTTTMGFINDLFIKLKKKQTISIGNYTYDKDYQVPSIMVWSLKTLKKNIKMISERRLFNYDRF